MFVDQFEETFTAGADRDEQEEFISRLLDLVDRPDMAVVLAIRADHLGRCATYPELVDRLTGNDVLVGPMRDSELRRTVELPAQRSGLEIEHGLVEVIVGDVAGRAGALPLLSTALAETWERREGRALTLTGYRAAGGVNGALARMADDAYAALPAGPQAAARRLLLRLCDAGDEGDLSLRRRLPIAEAADEHDADARAALETLTNRRLLTIDSDAVEIAHEALLREWPRLRTWLDEDVQGRRLHRRLHDATRSWEAAGHDPSELYRGTRLDAATDWAVSHDDELSHIERAFLDASRAQSEHELADARRQAADRARSNRRLRTLLVGVGVLLVVAMVAGLLAARESRRAERRADESELQRLLAQAESLQATRGDLATLLALEANRLSPGVQTESAVLGALQADPTFLGYLRMPDGARPFSVAAAAAGNRLVIGDVAGRLMLFDLSTGEPIREPVQVAEGYDAIRSVVTDPSGTTTRGGVPGRSARKSARPRRTRAPGAWPRSPVVLLDLDTLTAQSGARSSRPAGNRRTRVRQGAGHRRVHRNRPGSDRSAALGRGDRRRPAGRPAGDSPVAPCRPPPSRRRWRLRPMALSPPAKVAHPALARVGSWSCQRAARTRHRSRWCAGVLTRRRSGLGRRCGRARSRRVPRLSNAGAGSSDGRSRAHGMGHRPRGATVDGAS